MKIKEFPKSSRQKVLQTLYKICSLMISDGKFLQIYVEGFDHSERQIIERLIGEDIILRREVPTSGLVSLGVENISFTYDELRDFLLAHYAVENLAATNPSEFNSIFEKIPIWPIYEGFFRYSYVLARKNKCNAVLIACEASKDFLEHYLNNLSLLSADIQTHEDVTRVITILQGGTRERDLYRVAWFLFRKRDDSELLNIRILLDYVNNLNDKESERLVRIMFTSSSDYGASEWRSRVSNMLKSFINLNEVDMLELEIHALALALHFAPHAHWAERENTIKIFAKYYHKKQVGGAIKACQNAVSDKVQNCLKEIVEEREVYER